MDDRLAGCPICAKCGKIIMPWQTPWEWDDHKYYHLECQPSYDISKQKEKESQDKHRKRST